MPVKACSSVKVIVVAAAVLLAVSVGVADEGDWPMWRYDAGRTAASPAELASQLHLQWVRESPPPKAAWSQEQYKLQFDRSYELVAMGRQLFVGSMVSDSVTAYDTRTGQENWRFYTDGPVRFAPVAADGKVWFVSDDGALYCLKADDGSLLHRIMLAPNGRRVLGNGRLISTWPARGGPVLYDGTIYCAAGIWPFMGIFIYAIDAQTGRIVWENSGSGATWTTQQHNSPAFGGVAPQGYIAATEDRLLLTSRTTPACFDRRTGTLVYYKLSDRAFGKHAGGYQASIWGDWFFNSDVLYRLADGEGIVSTAARVMGPDAVVAFNKDGSIVAYRPQEVQDPNKTRAEAKLKARGLWMFAPVGSPDRIHIQAGRRLYVSNAHGNIAAIDTPAAGGKAAISWTHRVKGRVWTMIAADERLFVVTEDGLMYCFGPRETASTWHSLKTADPPEVADSDRRRDRRVLEGSDKTGNGYAVMLGLGDGRLLRAMAAECDTHIVVLEPDAEKVRAARDEYDAAGLYGRRVHIIQADPASAPLPAYMAGLLITEDTGRAQTADVDSLRRWYETLRPYGGAAWFFAPEADQEPLRQRLDQAGLFGAQVGVDGDAVVLRRTGGPPGSADWVGQYADIANTVCSKDQLKAPLGLLWYGDESEFTDVLPRHGHGPPEQVVGGRLYIQGVDSLSARDVYTGRVLWKRPLRDSGAFGVYYDASYVSDFRDLTYNQRHIPGASIRGANYFVTPDRVYVIEDAKCRVLDAVTGADLAMFALPDGEDGPAKRWTYIGVYEDKLIAGADFVSYTELPAGGSGSEAKLETFSEFFDKSASQRLIVMDRRSGEVLWQVTARHGFPHNAVIAGDSRLFCLDAIPPYLKQVMGRRNIDIPDDERLLALDVAGGRVVWERTQPIFGSWLGYSQEHKLLLQAQRRSKDMVSEPGDRMAVHRADTGDVLWDRKVSYDGPCILHGTTIITQESAYDLMTGRQKRRPHPLSGESVAWQYTRNYGCNTVIASENLLTFRSAAAGFLDLATDGGTGNLGGFKSGCTSNLVVAGGVLNAPEYTRTCTCSYQNQTSLAMVHDPDVEVWTFSPLPAARQRVQRLGLNLGAPGDCTSESGTLWLDWPSVGGPGPRIDVRTEPSRPRWFRHHSLRLAGGPLPWVEASGAIGLRQIRIGMGGPRGRSGRYTVRLHFVDPRLPRDEGRKTTDEESQTNDERGNTKYKFAVAIQGQTVLEGFDVTKEAGGTRIGLLREFTGIEIADALTVTLRPSAQGTETVLCGVELVME